MRILPINMPRKSPIQPILFSGINRNEFIDDRELSGGYNLSSDFLPAISQRAPRLELYPTERLPDPKAIFTAGGELCWIDGNSFYYGGALKGTVDGTKTHSMVDFNGFVVILPEKYYYCYDALNPEYNVFGKFGVGDCENADGFTAVASTIVASNTQKMFGTKSMKCTATAGSGYFGCVSKNYTFKVDPKQYQLVTGYVYGTGNARLDVLRASNNAGIGTSPVTAVSGAWKRLACVVLPANLTGEDYVLIQMTVESAGVGSVCYVDGLMVTQISADDWENRVDLNENYLASKPFLPTPEMDFCTQHYNRVFACKGSAIYASAWGDFKTWSKFEGTNQDSYATDVATEGDFTGIFTYDNHVTFFKDNFVEELFGSLPRNYQLMGMAGYGLIGPDAVAEGGGIMMFADPLNVYLYTGGRPTIVGYELNEKGYSDVKIASDGEKFYVLFIYDTTRRMYCFDIRTKTWMPEDDLDVVSFTTLNQKVYALDSIGRILRFNDGEEEIVWSAETKTWDDGLFENKRVKNVKLALKMENGSVASIYSKCDDGEWVLEKTIENDNNSTYLTARAIVNVNRARRFQLKFVGTGKVLIYGEREFDIVSQY